MRMLPLLLTLVVALSSASTAGAASITLVSQIGGTYNYGLVTGVDEVVVFHQDDFIMLSNLVGVISATTSGQLGIFTATFTDNSVTLNIPPPPFQEASFGADGIFELLTVVSTSSTAGNVQYVIDSASRSINTGLVNGPVRPAVVPEPSSFALLGEGLLGIAMWRRRFCVTSLKALVTRM